MEQKKQILLIHGGDTHRTYEDFLTSLKNTSVKLEWMVSRRDWKNELQYQLWSDFLVYLPQMPNKQNAQYEEWKIVFEKIIDKLDNNFILIGHSLGAMFIVKYLSENTISKTIEKTLLLGTPFDNSIKTDPLAGFLRQGNLQKLAEQAGKLFFYHSEDDFAVPFEHVLKYKEALPYASFRLMKDRNHFLQEEVPELNFDILH